MKTIFLSLTFFFAVFSGSSNDIEAKTISFELVCSNWVEVDPGCDNHFWLCTDSYEDVEDLMADVLYFSDGRC